MKKLITIPTFSCNQVFYSTAKKTLKINMDHFIPSSKPFDYVGPPDTVSRLRPVKYYIPPAETKLQKHFRETKQSTFDWNQLYWHNHNTSFQNEKQAFIIQKLSDKYSKNNNTTSTSSSSSKNDGKNAKQNLTAEEMAVFYKTFLDVNYKQHMDYNIQWYWKNFKNLKLAVLVWFERLLFNNKT